MPEHPPLEPTDEPTQPTGVGSSEHPTQSAGWWQPPAQGGGGPDAPAQTPGAQQLPPGWGGWWGPPGATPPGGVPYGGAPYGGVPYGGAPYGGVPYGAPPYGYGAPPYGGVPYGAGSPPPPQRQRQHPVLTAAATVAAAAMIALGVGIGYIVWGPTTAPAGTRSALPSSPAPVRPTVPGTGSGFGGLPGGSTGGLPGGSTAGSTHGSSKGFLGVEVSPTPAASSTTKGAHVVAVVPGSPAAKAGITAGDTIDAFGTRTVVSTITLEFDTQADAPGTKVTVGWTTSTGKHEHATVTLATRPSGGTSVG